MGVRDRLGLDAARANGRHVGSRGRIAKAIVDHYNWEHPDAPYDPDR